MTDGYTKYIQIVVDVYYAYRGETFVWDGRKAGENRAKHGVRFETACEVFFDPGNADEDASVDDERRLAVIGRTLAGKTLYVVNVEREPRSIRIISAREATSREREFYEDGC